MVELLVLYCASWSCSNFFVCSDFHFPWCVLPWFPKGSTRHRRVRCVCGQHCLPVLNANSIAGLFILGDEGWELCGAAEAGSRTDHLIDVFCAWHCRSHSVGSIDEGGSLWLRQSLKASVREAWEPSSHQTLLHIKQAGRAARCGPTVSKVERSFDRETACRGGEITRCSRGRNTSLHYIMQPNSKPLGFLPSLQSTHRHVSVRYWMWAPLPEVGVTANWQLVCVPYYRRREIEWHLYHWWHFLKEIGSSFDGLGKIGGKWCNRPTPALIFHRSEGSASDKYISRKELFLKWVLCIQHH